MGSARGALAAAAFRVGAQPADYAQRVVAGEKWCTGCKDWHPIDDFGSDQSRPDGRATACLKSRQRRHRALYVPKPRTLRGFLVEARPGDKKQARRRVNYLVEQGRIQHPNERPCTDCGHVWNEGERRHEYDHFEGYDPAAQLLVEAVCTTHHHQREARRREDLRVLEYPKKGLTRRQRRRRITAKEGTPLDTPTPKPPPVEPEVEDRIPLEPEQLQRALENQIIGQLVARVVCFRSTKDQRERYAVVMESGACLLFAPAGQNLVMTLIQNVQNVQEGG